MNEANSFYNKKKLFYILKKVGWLDKSLTYFNKQFSFVPLLPQKAYEVNMVVYEAALFLNTCGLFLKSSDMRVANSLCIYGTKKKSHCF